MRGGAPIVSTVRAGHPPGRRESVARVIESLMFAALGFLAASLCALLVLPALNARAERLTRRRLEALYPMSIVELTAEKDHLRAEFAVRERQLERRVEEFGEQRAQLSRQLEDMEGRLGKMADGYEALERRFRDLAASNPPADGAPKAAPPPASTAPPTASGSAAHGAL